MLTNPYPIHDHKIQSYASSEDVFYLRRLFPMKRGAVDAVLATLYRSFITHLRYLEKQNGQPFDPAFHPFHPTEILVQRVMERCSFGDDPTEAGSRHEPDGVDGVHPEVCNATPECSDVESVNKRRKGTKKGEGKK